MSVATLERPRDTLGDLQHEELFLVGGQSATAHRQLLHQNLANLRSSKSLPPLCVAVPRLLVLLKSQRSPCMYKAAGLQEPFLYQDSVLPEVEIVEETSCMTKRFTDRGRIH